MKTADHYVKSSSIAPREIRSHDFWHYINLYVCMYKYNVKSSSHSEHLVTYEQTTSQ